jgi:hypothetical protein
MAEPVSQQTKIAIVYCSFALLFVGGLSLLQFDGNTFMVKGAADGPVAVSLRSTESPVAVPKVIASYRDWHAAVSHGKSVVFIDCEWNPEVAAFRKPFADFAQWCVQDANCEAFSATLKLDEPRDELWNEIQRLLEANAITGGGMRNLGGAGRIVWIKNGRVVDYAWFSEAFTRDDLVARTIQAFS